MSKVNAYRCDFCGVLKSEDECSGVSPVRDLFDPLESNKACDCDKSEVHFCLDCYHIQVTVPVGNMTYRQRDEAHYIKTLKEMTYAFKQIIFHKVKEAQKKQGKKFVS